MVCNIEARLKPSISSIGQTQCSRSPLLLCLGKVLGGMGFYDKWEGMGDLM